jgi:hypothetical protein
MFCCSGSFILIRNRASRGAFAANLGDYFINFSMVRLAYAPKFSFGTNFN